MERLFERLKTILLTPDIEWRVIASEPNDTLALLTRYVAVLALIPASAGFFGASLFGYGSILAALIGAAARYLLTFAAVFIVAHIVVGGANHVAGVAFLKQLGDCTRRQQGDVVGMRLNGREHFTEVPGPGTLDHRRGVRLLRSQGFKL